MTVHTTFKKGTKIFVILKDGEKFHDYYEGKKNKFIFLRDRGKVLIKSLRSTGFFRNKIVDKDE